MGNPSVLITGAGPTGLALACDLARRGVSFRIIDKTEAYFGGSRGKGLQPRSLEVLDDLGVIERILECGRFHLPFRGYEGSKVLGDRDIHEGRHPTPDVPYASSMVIPQWRVEETLRNLMEKSGHRVELGTELMSFEQDAGGVSATLNHGGKEERVRVDYLVGCDGGHSTVRHALGVGFEGETWATERMYVGDVKVDGLDRDHWHSWPDKERGWIALCPLPSTDSFQFQAQIGPEETAEPSLERFQQLIDERTGGMPIKLHDTTWLSLFRANVRMVDRYRVGRAFLAGDAAHVHSPAGGQGMNTGIQDAYNLGWKLGLALKGGPEWLLDCYEEERLPVAARMLGITSKLHRNLLPAKGDDMHRDAEFLQLAINYRGHRLARELRSAPGPVQAGDRAPDAPCRRADGSAVRLFDVFRGPQFTLLSFGEGSGDSIVDAEGHAGRAYGASKGTRMLVRPDGYVAAAAENEAAIHAYLDELGNPATRAVTLAVL